MKSSVACSTMVRVLLAATLMGITNTNYPFTNCPSLLPSDDGSRKHSSGGRGQRAYKSAWSKCRSGRGWFVRYGDRPHSRPYASRRSDAACADWRGVPRLSWLCLPTAISVDGSIGGRQDRQRGAVKAFYLQLLPCHLLSTSAMIVGQVRRAEPCAPYRLCRAPGCIPFPV